MKWLYEHTLGKLYQDNVWTHWQAYKDFFNITVFRYLVTWFAIVPLIAKLLSRLPQEINFMRFGNNFYTITLSLPFTWEWLWIASLLFIIAYGLYAWKCPKLVKKYSSLKDYKNDMHSPRWLTWLSRDIINDKEQYPKFFERMSTKNYFVLETNVPAIDRFPTVIVQNEQTVLYFRDNRQLYSFGMPILTNGVEDKALTEIAEREVFWEVFGRFSSSKRNWRFVILTLLYLSGICFSIVLFEHIFSGFEYFFR